MKKVFLSILTFLYMMISTGIAMEVHYCMGKRVGADFFHKEDEKCGRCGMKERENGCCRDEIKFYKYSESFNTQKESNFNYENSFVGPTPIAIIAQQWISFASSPIVILPTVDDTGPPLRILYCNYRI